MNLISDDYISYDDSFTVKQEKLSDSEESLAPPLLVTLESTTLCTPTSLSAFQSFSSPDSFIRVDHSSQSSHLTSQKRKPFIIIKTKKEDSGESVNLKLEDDQKLLSKSKRIAKRVKAKQRSQLKQEYSCSMSSSSKCVTEACEDPSADGKSKKKVIQMIRNRVSAQTSREKKKIYVQSLEQAKEKLSEAYSKLFSENAKLLLEVKKLKSNQAKLLQEGECLRKSSVSTGISCGDGIANQIQENLQVTNISWLGEEVRELSDMFASGIPECDTAQFRDTFKCATLAAFQLLTNKNSCSDLRAEGLCDLKEMTGLVSKALERIGSAQPGDFSLDAVLKEVFLRKEDAAGIQNTEFLPDLKNGFAFEPCPVSVSMIKIEQPEINDNYKSHLSIFNQLLGFQSSDKINTGYSSEDPTITSASPKTLRYYNEDDEEQQKGSLFQSCFGKIEYFGEDIGAENAKFDFLDSQQSFLPNLSNYSDSKDLIIQDLE